jgi:hypothetical protein
MARSIFIFIFVSGFRLVLLIQLQHLQHVETLHHV